MIIGIMEVVKIFYKSVGKRLMENGIILTEKQPTCTGT